MGWLRGQKVTIILDLSDLFPRPSDVIVLDGLNVYRGRGWGRGKM